MSKQRKTAPVAKPLSDKAQELAEITAQLMQAGYTATVQTVALDVPHDTPDIPHTLSSMFTGEVPNMGHLSDQMLTGNATPTSTPDSIGTPGCGYIDWGFGNRLPNLIPVLVGQLPYTAAAVKFNADTVAGAGPKLKYKFSRVVNGTIKTELIDYDQAGPLLLDRLKTLYTQLSEAQEKEPDSTAHADSAPRTVMFADAVAGLHNPNPADDNNTDAHLLGKVQILRHEIAQAKADYANWQRTNAAVTVLLENNNFQLTLLKLLQDEAHMGISFPELELSQGRTKEEWQPRIVGLRHRSVTTTRFEQMQDNGRIEYVYVSNKWRNANETPVDPQTPDMAAIRVLNPETALADLRKNVEKQRKAPLKKRTTHYVLPTYYPSIDRPYYPCPSWWSIFPGRIYQYASTLMRDKATERSNSNMWGKIVYVHTAYLNALYAEQGASTPEKKAEIRNALNRQILGFLKNRDNNGKALFTQTITHGDKQLKCIEIVDVPRTETGAVTKTELEEIASIIFFAMEVHPSLIGAVPGKSGSTGGTSQREMDLLKQKRSRETRERYLKLLSYIHAFNGYDKNGVWVISDVALTTLDRSSTGITESQDTN